VAAKKPAFKIKRPGALTAKANAAGQSVYAYAQAHENDSGLTGTQSRLYLNVFRPAANKRRKAVTNRLKSK